MFIYPYRPPGESKSVYVLKQCLDAKVIKLTNSKFVGDPGKNVLNWGNSNPMKELAKCDVLNNPEAVKFASNKINFFDKVKDVVDVPEYTTDVEEALNWVRDGHVVFGRCKLTGSGGNDIIILEQEQDFENYILEEVKFYSKYIPKKNEYRVHVFCGKVLDIQKKSTKYGKKPKDFRVRNHSRGFIFTRDNVGKVPDYVYDQCIKAVEAVGLDFGAVDVIHNVYRDKAYVLEVNTAPGLENTTLFKYVNAIRDHFGMDALTEVDLVIKSKGLVGPVGKKTPAQIAKELKFEHAYKAKPMWGGPTGIDEPQDEPHEVDEEAHF